MDHLEVVNSVIQLARDNSALTQTCSRYEEWFRSIVGRRATLKTRKGRKTTFYNGTVVFFSGSEWELETDEGEIVFVYFKDWVKGSFWLI